MNLLATWLGVFGESRLVDTVFLLAKLTLLLATAWILQIPLRNRNPRWRVLIWRSTGTGVLVLASLALFPPFVKLGVLPGPATENIVSVPLLEAPSVATPRGIPAERVAPLLPKATLSSGDANAASQGVSSADSGRGEPEASAVAMTPSALLDLPSNAISPEKAAATPPSFDGVPWLTNGSLLIWGTGVLVGLFWAVTGLCTLKRIRHTAAPAPKWIVSEATRVAASLGLRIPFDVRHTGELQSPCLIGLGRPMVLLPSRQCAGGNREELASILAHELAHLKGGDLAWNALLNWLSLLLWFHPLMWRVRATHADACDDVSDALAAHYVGDASLYGRILARLTLRTTATRVAVGLAMARPSGVRRRIEALRRHVFGAGLPRRRALFVIALVLLATMGVGSLGLTRSQAADPSNASTKETSAKSESPESDNAKSEPRVVTGEVVSAEDGKPIAGARVLLRDAKLHQATTDDQGRFRLEKIPPGKYLIWAYKDHLASKKEPLEGVEATPANGSLFEPIRLTMAVGKQVQFTVTSAVTNEPLEGADVQFAYPDRRKATTDKTGTAVVQGLLPEKYEITIQAAGHAYSIREVDLSESEQSTPLSVQLSAGGVVRGVVTGDEEKPLDRADVTFREAGSAYGYSGDSPRTNAQGEFRHAHLPLGKAVEVSVSMKDYLPLKKEILLTAQQKEQRLDFQLQRRPQGGSVAGFVTDLDGKAVADATVGNYGNSRDSKREVRTDRLGRFVLHDLLKGHNATEIFVQAEGFAPQLQTVEPGSADAPSDVTVKLEPGHSVRGRVQNGAGEPIRNAYVMDNSHNQGKRPWQLMNSVKTDAEGRFEFNSLRSNTTFRVSADQYSTLEEVALKLDAKEIASITLEPIGVVRGRVVDSTNGKPVSQFNIRVSFSKESKPDDVRGTYDGRLGDPGRTFRSKDGEFVLSGVTNRMAVALVVEAPGYERGSVTRAVAHPADDKTSIDIPLKKRDLSQLAMLSGTVLDHDSKPLAGVQLRLISSTKPSSGESDDAFNWALINSGQLGQKPYVEQYLSAISDDEGKFEFKELLPGKYLQIAYWGRHAPKGRFLGIAKTKPGKSQSVAIPLPQPSRVEGSFGIEEFPRAGSIRLDRQNDTFHDYEFPLAEGKHTFVFEDVPPGKYWISVVAQPERDKANPQMTVLRPIASRQLTVAPGSTHEVLFMAKDAVKQP